MEGAYLTETQSWGNIFKGWDGYVANKFDVPSPSHLRAQGAVEKKNKKLKDSDRLFSNSSCTAPQVLRQFISIHLQGSESQAQAAAAEPEASYEDSGVDEFGWTLRCSLFSPP